ncbi:MAG: NfeD family protein [Clostridia bacterium]|nr:NfeD family protein [Clostridia bacterium]
MAMVYGWLAVVVIAIIVEVIVPGLVSIWFVPSALVAMVLAFFSVPVIIQVAVFLVSSGLFIFLSRKFIGTGKKSTRTNIDSVIGERCIVAEKIDNIHATGKVKLNGMDWTARSLDSEVTYEVDDIVYVDRVEGVKLIVKK